MQLLHHHTLWYGYKVHFITTPTTSNNNPLQSGHQSQLLLVAHQLEQSLLQSMLQHQPLPTSTCCSITNDLHLAHVNIKFCFMLVGHCFITIMIVFKVTYHSQDKIVIDRHMTMVYIICYNCAKSAVM